MILQVGGVGNARHQDTARLHTRCHRLPSGCENGQPLDFNWPNITGFRHVWRIYLYLTRGFFLFQGAGCQPQRSGHGTSPNMAENGRKNMFHILASSFNQPTSRKNKHKTWKIMPVFPHPPLQQLQHLGNCPSRPRKLASSLWNRRSGSGSNLLILRELLDQWVWPSNLKFLTGPELVRWLDSLDGFTLFDLNRPKFPKMVYLWIHSPALQAPQPPSTCKAPMSKVQPYLCTRQSVEVPGLDAQPIDDHPSWNDENQNSQN